MTSAEARDCDIVVYDPFVHSSHEDPYPIYRILRDKIPVYYNDERDVWALTRFDDVQSAARDWRTFSSAAGVELDDAGAQFGVLAGSFIDQDPPGHDLLRKVLAKRFSPKSILELREVVEKEVDRLLARLLDRHEADLAEEFAAPLPVAMVSEMLGLPAEDRGFLEGTARDIVVRTPGRREIPRTASDAASNLLEYFREHVRAQRGRPRAGLLDQVLEASIDGQAVPTETVLGMCYLLFVAGTETTSSLISSSLLALARHPQQRALLAADASSIPTAIEELLRYESPVQQLARRVVTDVELHGRRIPEGSRVALLFGAANRDERRFPDADRLDVTREPRRHLGFGEGIHHCLGAPLARLEARIALERLLAAVPEYEVAGPVERLPSNTTRGVARLPVVY
jgi:cytochrome P450